MMKKPICGRVAKVLNTRELALNIGEKQGVEIGMKFDVMDTTGENIKDPDTSEIIGSIERPKVRIKIVNIQEKLSVASTYRTHRVNKGGQIHAVLGLRRAFLPAEWVAEKETLKTTESTWEDLPEHQSYVKTGDKVIEVILDEDESQ